MRYEYTPETLDFDRYLANQEKYCDVISKWQTALPISYDQANNVVKSIIELSHSLSMGFEKLNDIILEKIIQTEYNEVFDDIVKVSKLIMIKDKKHYHIDDLGKFEKTTLPKRDSQFISNKSKYKKPR